MKFFFPSLRRTPAPFCLLLLLLPEAAQARKPHIPSPPPAARATAAPVIQMATIATPMAPVTAVAGVEMPEGCLAITWAEQAAKVTVPKGVYQVTLEEFTSSWQPVRVQHLVGNGGTVTFPLIGRPRQADFRVRAFTSNKFGTTASSAAPAPFTVHNPEPEPVAVPETPVTAIPPAPVGPVTPAPVSSVTPIAPIAPVAPAPPLPPGTHLGSSVPIPTLMATGLPVPRLLGSTGPATGTSIQPGTSILSNSTHLVSSLAGHETSPVLSSGTLVLKSTAAIEPPVSASTLQIAKGGNTGIVAIDATTLITGTTLTAVSTGILTLSNTVSFSGAVSGVANAVATTLSSTNSLADSTALAASIDGSLAAPVAVESDIWKFVGDRLFYFNQFRGLQVIDIHDPAQPRKLGTLRMPAMGDQLQVLDAEGRYLALFIRQANNGWQSQIHIVKISDNGEPALVKTLPLDGYMGETRLIGTRLYVLYSGWWNEAGRQTNLRLRGFDLTDPTAPVDLGYAAGTGYQPVLQDAGTHLLIAANDITDGTRTVIHAIDLSNEGRPRLVKSVKLTGYLHDQFKMSIVGGAIVAVSEIRTKWVYDQHTTTTGNQVHVDYTYTVYPAHTWVESFALAGESTEPLAKLHLDDATGEQLYAVRFGGKRLYVVTYGVKQTEPRTFSSSYSYVVHGPCDPLFIIDLDDPANPVVRGQLAIPGWSNFMETVGDRLLSVGREDSHIAASLFDVSNADAPSLLSRVYPGSADTYWAQSESETEHRAVTWLREQKKFMVPYKGWGANGAVSGTQEVNYTNNKLTLGDTVRTEAATRRGTSINGYLLAISGRELVVATDAGKGETSKTVATLELAWPVDRIVPVGDYLIEIESLGSPTQYEWGWYWPNVDYYSTSGCRANNQVVLRLTSRNDPETLLDSVELQGGQSTIVSTTVRGGRLFLAQWLRDPGDQTAQLRTYAIRPNNGKIQQLDSATTVIPLAKVLLTSSIQFNDVQALWLANDRLVWFIPCGQRFDDYCWTWVYGWNAPNDSPPPAVVADRHRLSAGWGNSVCALVSPVVVNGQNISTTAKPLSISSASREAMLLSTSRAFTDNGRLFFSSTQKVDKDDFDHDADMQKTGEFAPDPSSDKPKTTLLHVLNFDNHDCLEEERDNTALPGTLVGASTSDVQGAWLLCGGVENSGTASRLLSLAYDGVMVRRRDRQDISFVPAGSDSRNGLLLVPKIGAQPYRQSQNNGKIETLVPWTTESYVARLRISGKAVTASSSQWLGVARINTDRSLTPLVTKSFAGYSTQLLSDQAAIDLLGFGAWVPAAEYGLEWIGFDNQQPVIAAGSEE